VDLSILLLKLTLEVLHQKLILLFAFLPLQIEFLAVAIGGTDTQDVPSQIQLMLMPLVVFHQKLKQLFVYLQPAKSALACIS
jgi:hypothetical protein